MDLLQRLYSRILHYAGNLEPHHWIILLVVLILIGLFCLKGFGSRANY